MSFGFLNLGPTELVIVLLIVLVIFGPRKLPDIGRAFGEMLANFRSSDKHGESTENEPPTEDGDKHSK